MGPTGPRGPEGPEASDSSTTSVIAIVALVAGGMAFVGVVVATALRKTLFTGRGSVQPKGQGTDHRLAPPGGPIEIALYQSGGARYRRGQAAPESESMFRF